MAISSWAAGLQPPQDYTRDCRRYVPDRPYLAWRRVETPDNSAWWFMSGAGGQFCVLIPARRIVMAKLNDWRNRTNGAGGLTQVGLKEFVPLLSRLAAPACAAQPGE